MFLCFILTFALAEEKEGVTGTNGVFLPLVPKSRIDARGILPDYPDLRIPLLRFFRFISSFAINGEEKYGLQTVFGYAHPLSNEDNEFKVNISSYGIGGPLSNEDQPTFNHLCEFTSQLEPGSVILELWGKLSDEQGMNHSVLLFNGTAEFYEVVNVQDQVASVSLYCFFVGVVGWILYKIFSKDKIKESKPVSKKKKVIQDYSQIHDRNRSPSPGKPRTQSPPARQQK